MDTIFVINAGSSSVKFQVFAVDEDGRLRRQLKGKMDGVGSRPRLRATGATGETIADRAYPVENVPNGHDYRGVVNPYLEKLLGSNDACLARASTARSEWAPVR